jgi:hypothetical protein
MPFAAKLDDELFNEALGEFAQPAAAPAAVGVPDDLFQEALGEFSGSTAPTSPASASAVEPVSLQPLRPAQPRVGAKGAPLLTPLQPAQTDEYGFGRRALEALGAAGSTLQELGPQDAALAVADAAIRGGVDLGKLAASGLFGLARGAVTGAVPGGEGFLQGTQTGTEQAQGVLNQLPGGLASAPKPTQVIGESLAIPLDAATAAGDVVFEETGSPLAGALTQAAGVAFPFRKAGPKLTGQPRLPPVEAPRVDTRQVEVELQPPPAPEGTVFQTKPPVEEPGFGLREPPPRPSNVTDPAIFEEALGEFSQAFTQPPTFVKEGRRASVVEPLPEGRFQVEEISPTGKRTVYATTEEALTKKGFTKESQPPVPQEPHTPALESSRPAERGAAPSNVVPIRLEVKGATQERIEPEGGLEQYQRADNLRSAEEAGRGDSTVSSAEVEAEAVRPNDRKIKRAQEILAKAKNLAGEREPRGPHFYRASNYGQLSEEINKRTQALKKEREELVGGVKESSYVNEFGIQELAKYVAETGPKSKEELASFLDDLFVTRHRDLTEFVDQRKREEQASFDEETVNEATGLKLLEKELEEESLALEEARRLYKEGVTVPTDRRAQLETEYAALKEKWRASGPVRKGKEAGSTLTAEQFEIIGSLVKNRAEAIGRDFTKVAKDIADQLGVALEVVLEPVRAAWEKHKLGVASFEEGRESEPFYSNLERYVERAKIDKAPGQAWLNHLRGQQELSREELKATGLEGYLSLKGNEPVTRAEVLERLREEPVEVFGGVIPSVAHAEKTLPGGESYDVRVVSRPIPKPITVKEARARQLEEESKGILDVVDRAKAHGIVDRLEEQARKERKEHVFMSPEEHFGYIPNQSVFTRSKEFKAEDGKRVGMMQEVQSDHAQRLEKKGAEEPEYSVSQGGHTEWFSSLQRAEDYRARFGGKFREHPGVPPTPFRGKEATLLGLKDYINHAVEQGYDRVAWPASAEQIARIEKWTNPRFNFRQEGAQYFIGDGRKPINVTPIVNRYLKDLPKLAEDYVSQWETKVERTKLEGGEEVFSFDITPGLKAAAQTGEQPILGKRSRRAQQLDNEFAELVTEWRKPKYSAGAFGGERVDLLVKMIQNRLEKGLVTFAEVASDIAKKLPEVKEYPELMEKAWAKVRRSRRRLERPEEGAGEAAVKAAESAPIAGASRETLGKLRELRGLEGIGPSARQRHAEILERAKEEGVPEASMEIIAELKNHTRPLSAEETVGILYRQAEIELELDKLAGALETTDMKGKIRTTGAAMKRLEQELQAIESGLAESMSRSGRSLRVAQMVLDRSFTPRGLTRAAKAEKGDVLTEAEAKEFKALGERLVKLDEAYKAAEKKARELTAQKAVAKAKELKKGAKELKAEQNDLVERLKELARKGCEGG